MTSPWKSALLGGVAGAVVAIAVVYLTATLGIFPMRADYAIHDYLMSHPDIVVAMMAKLQDEQDESDNRASQVAVTKLGTNAFFDPRVAFVTGPDNAKRTFVEFFDYNCPFCRQSFPAVKQFYAVHKNDTRFAFIEFPIKGPDSTFAARVALAARKQGNKYLALHFALMSEEDHVDQKIIMADARKVGIDMTKLEADMKSPGVDRGIDESLALAQAANIKSTPFFIINGKIQPGAIDANDLRKLAKA